MTFKPAAMSAEQAQEYLGVSANRWRAIRSSIPSLGRDWYATADLDAYIEQLRRERDQAKPSKPKPMKTPTEFLRSA